MPQKESLVFSHIEKTTNFCREFGKVLQRSWESSAEKLGKFTRVVAQTDASFLRTAQQDEFYLSLMNKLEKAPDENPSNGIILCAEKTIYR